MRSETPAFIATESILWLHPDGTETMIEARIGTPYRRDAQSWACPASLEGVDGPYADIVGGSSLQALALATQLIATRLAHLLEDNAQLVYPVDRSPWDRASHSAIFGTADASWYGQGQTCRDSEGQHASAAQAVDAGGDYGRVGRFIYGAYRHGGDISDVYNWMADALGIARPEVGDASAVPVDLYSAFFAKYPGDEAFDASYERFIESLHAREG